jgi:hypothetical protein
MNRIDGQSGSDVEGFMSPSSKLNKRFTSTGRVDSLIHSPFRNKLSGQFEESKVAYSTTCKSKNSRKFTTSSFTTGAYEGSVINSGDE